MKILYSNILPLPIADGQQIFIDYFAEALTKADRVDIAVGYVSKASLEELRRLVTDNHITNISLIIGMYYLEGMPEEIYHTAVSLSKLWREEGIGEVRLVKPFKFHGKIYLFYKDGHPFSGIVGSHNLGALKLEAGNRRQYEVSALTETVGECTEIAQLVDKLKHPNCTENIEDINNIQLIHEENGALVGQEFVTKVTSDEVEAYRKKLINVSFEIPLKVPANKDDPKMRGSNINVCYASGRKRVWWEIEMVVGKEIRELPGYPEYQKPFMAVTDDGWKFQVWTCGQNNKNLYSKDDLKILGRWIKGRLVAAGLVEPVNQVEADTKFDGLITGDMLEKYGRKNITLTKTSLKTVTEDRDELDVWLLSFLPEKKLFSGG